MLIQSGIDYNLSFSVLDSDPEAPCKKLSDFHAGKLTDYDTVMKFGSACDIITIEIENVNTKALHDLAQTGKKVYPQPAVIELIQDKRKQKEFYRQADIPTSEFILTETKADVQEHSGFLPAVHKLGREGYDGRGVQILKNQNDLERAFDAPGVLERLIDFEKEISVIVTRSEQGEVKTYPPVEMVFHPEHNLVEYLFSPAQVNGNVQDRADTIARQVAEN